MQYTDFFVSPNGYFYQFENDKLEPTHPSCKLMIFTGVYDKNGEEVYEGDILLCCDEFGVVEYNRYMASFECKFKSNTKSIDYIVSNHLDIIIIGNIYENPKLIK
jgi:hypothetical protein